MRRGYGGGKRGRREVAKYPYSGREFPKSSVQRHAEKQAIDHKSP